LRIGYAALPRIKVASLIIIGGRVLGEENDEVWEKLNGTIRMLVGRLKLDLVWFDNVRADCEAAPLLSQLFGAGIFRCSVGQLLIGGCGFRAVGMNSLRPRGGRSVTGSKDCREY